MGSKWIYVAILGMACMMLAVNGTNSSNSTASSSSISSNMTMNLTNTSPPNITTNLTMTRPPNVTLNLTQTSPPNITTNLTMTRPPNMTLNVTQTSPPNITTNQTMTRPPNMTLNMTQTNPPNITTNLTMTRPPNVTLNMTQTSPPNITNLTMTRPPNMTLNVTQTSPSNITTNLTQTRPPSMTNTITLPGSNIITNINNQSLAITSRDNCRSDRACFSAPPTCNPGAQSSCYFLSTRGITGNADNFTFELSGESDGYIAAGLSRDSSGQGATIYSCTNFNGVLRFIRATLNNQRLTQDNTFIPGSFRGSVNGRKIQCIFNAAGLGSSTARAVTTETFVFVLTGSISNGSLDSPVIRLATNGSVDLGNPNSTDVLVITPRTNATASSNATASNVTANTSTIINKVTRDSCKKDKACFSTPASCDPSTSNGCFFASTKGINGNSDNLTFELSGESNGYIAVGLSVDNKEGDGDTIYSCANNNGELKFIRATLNTILTPDNTFKPGFFSGSVNNTKIQCIFTAANLNSSTRAANTNAYLFFFTGNFTNGTMGSPFTRMATNSSVDLTNLNSSDVAIITPTTNTASNTTNIRAFIVESNTVQHVASQAAVVILSAILAVLLL